MIIAHTVVACNILDGPTSSIHILYEEKELYSADICVVLSISVKYCCIFKNNVTIRSLGFTGREFLLLRESEFGFCWKTCQTSLQPPVFTDSISVAKLRPVRLCSRACTLAHLRILPGRIHTQLVWQWRRNICLDRFGWDVERDGGKNTAKENNNLSCFHFVWAWKRCCDLDLLLLFDQWCFHELKWLLTLCFSKSSGAGWWSYLWGGGCSGFCSISFYASVSLHVLLLFVGLIQFPPTVQKHIKLMRGSEFLPSVCVRARACAPCDGLMVCPGCWGRFQYASPSWWISSGEQKMDGPQSS